MSSSEIPKSLLMHLFTARRSVEECALFETKVLRTGDRPWGYDLEGYSDRFDSLLDEPLWGFIERLREHKGKVSVLDVMGIGGFHEFAQIDVELAISLTDPRVVLRKQIDEAQNFHLIEGDILNGKTWREVRNFMDVNAAQMNGGFDLITLLPGGGWNVVLIGDSFGDPNRKDNQPVNRGLEWIIVNRLINLLSPNGGVLLAQMHTWSDWNNWCDLINNSNILEAQSPQYSGSIMIRRLVPGRIKLPLIPAIK